MTVTNSNYYLLISARLVNKELGKKLEGTFLTPVELLSQDVLGETEGKDENSQLGYPLL
jgi:hypothetical protein